MRLLDACCCQGGAAVGYHRAGFDEIVGVDVVPQPRFPFEFVLGDAIEFIKEHGHEFDAIHISPPCQPYSITKHSHDNVHPELVEPARAALIASGKPWIMENVVGAPLLAPVTLCGTAFGLETTDTDGQPLYLRRHRLFESSEWLWQPECLCNWYNDRGYRCAGIYGGGAIDREKKHGLTGRRGGYTPAKAVAERLLGIDWMSYKGMKQSIPPAYTQWLGTQLLESINA